MYRQPRSQRPQTAQRPSRDNRGGDVTPRPTKQSMSEDEQLELAEDLEAINVAFLDTIGDNPSDKVVEQTLRDIESDNRAWLKDLHAKSQTHHEPLHLIVDALFMGDLEPELASLMIGQEGRLREVSAFLQIGDHTGTLPEDSYRKSKMDYLLALDPATVEHFEGPLNPTLTKKAVVKGIANRIKARAQQQERPTWGPVRVAFNAVVDRNNGMSWEEYRDYVELNARPKRGVAQTTRTSAKAKDTSDTTAVRPSEKTKAAIKAAERPSRKSHTPEPAARPSAKAKVDNGKAQAKSSPTRPSARTRSGGSKAPAKPQLDADSKAFVAKLRAANSGNEVIANSIADAIEAGGYDLDEAKAKVDEAGIKLVKSKAKSDS